MTQYNYILELVIKPNSIHDGTYPRDPTAPNKIIDDILDNQSSLLKSISNNIQNDISNDVETTFFLPEQHKNDTIIKVFINDKRPPTIIRCGYPLADLIYTALYNNKIYTIPIGYNYYEVYYENSKKRRLLQDSSEFGISQVGKLLNRAATTDPNQSKSQHRDMFIMCFPSCRDEISKSYDDLVLECGTLNYSDFIDVAGLEYVELVRDAYLPDVPLNESEMVISSDVHNVTQLIDNTKQRFRESLSHHKQTIVVIILLLLGIRTTKYLYNKIKR